MKIFAYIANEILLYVTLFFSVLFIVLLGNYTSSFLNRAVDGYIGLSTVIKLLCFITPGIIVLILPISVFGGIFVAFRQLCIRNELIVIFACGISWKKLFACLLIPVSLLTALTVILSFIIVPSSSANFQTLYQKAAVKSIQYIQPKKFYSMGKGEEMLFNYNKKTQKKEIIILFFRKNNVSVIYSPDYSIEQFEHGNFLSMHDGWEDVLNTENKSIKKLNFDSGLLRLDSTKNALNLTIAALGTEKLLHHLRRASEVELGWRLFTGFLPLIMLFFVFPFCGDITKKNTHLITILAIVCFFGFCIISSVIKNMLTTQELPLWFGFEIPGLIVFLIGAAWIFFKDKG